MTTSLYKWLVPALALVIGLLIVAAELGHDASPLGAAIGFGCVVGYAVILRLLQSRRETASLLSGIPVDERWEFINNRALSMTAQVVAVVLVSAFVIVQFQGGDAMPYALVGVVFAAVYLAALAWYRERS